jgi:TIR domain
MSHAFISYVHRDLDEVIPFINRLKEDGLNVWLDREALGPGVFWKDEIRHAIQDGNYFFACFSSSFAANKQPA